MLLLQCVDCGLALENDICPRCQRQYFKQDGLVTAYPKKLGELAVEEAKYHDMFDEDALEVHQLQSYRNWFYHHILWNAFNDLPAGDTIFEVGGGNGYDARELLKKFHVVETDVSAKTLSRTRDRLGDAGIDYVVADGEHLPAVDASVDGVLMVAVWHHFADPARALVEAERVLRPGGILVIGIEPNKTYFLPMKIVRPILSFFARMKGVEVSHADEEMTGFTYRQIRRYFSSIGEWESIQIRPMWLLAGWMHYFLEFIFRVFRLKKRIVLPIWFEKIIVGIDRLLFLIPGVKHLGWHWIVIAKNKEQRTKNNEQRTINNKQ